MKGEERVMRECEGERKRRERLEKYSVSGDP